MVSGKDKVLRRIRTIINIINLIAGVSVIGLVVYTFLDVENRMELFPYIFYMGSFVNAVTGIKHMISDKKLQGVVVWVFAVVLAVAGYLTGVIVA